MNVAYNMDCLEAMREMPDNAFELACCDPPYGGGCTDIKSENSEEEGLHSDITVTRTGGTWAAKYGNKELGVHFNGRGRSNKYADIREEAAPDISVHRSSKPGGTHKNYEQGTAINHWDIAPPPEYFTELARVSKNQIIWGGNYFGLPPTRCFLVWRKLTISENFTMAMAEYAWTSFNENAKVFECAPQGTKDDPRFHPCQKPVALYEWVFSHYAKPGDKILDTHLGSGSSRIAAYNLGLDFVGYEIDKVYFDLQEERFKRHSAQVTFFDLGANND